ncbi:MAG TPA: 1-acyl-sn-glycerol-3-phosphate acyltransferase [Firmicutes bacterium]|jgi:1-acyl-sn-glycerol-3-phosphate acyltransferase|nr:1-acyl-sn-glycerol-3-phosphate acyltransferase [Bacillota bacterium]HBE04936.1 1-acyl-sn-glycerol-3-phosphate acyltransferase [Bacillota bacterium]HBG44444.1 1-acyl-sn-glycerol-3-phosphate acyltransferase [Bacillota bacterium]HBL51091.1 1-acyl-sn-glycerol-3-phosphate acyltransferase [Bacillota bacterium]HBL67466.1 1-acyl-sn-glycerol-3-phosphate acyltransferase [Bacillota bacterium]
MMPLYAAVKGFCWVTVGLYNGFRIEGLENIPKEGPGIVVANHLSNWDPVILGTIVPRQIFFMAKKELFDNPIAAKAFKMVGAFKVRRGEADRDAIREAAEHLEQGRLVGVFVEGTRNRNIKEGFLPPQPGAAMLAVKTGAPIIPVALVNTGGTFKKMRDKVIVRVGAAITGFETRAGKHRLIYDEIGGQIMKSIATLYGVQ